MIPESKRSKTKDTVAIIDYGMGNLHSVASALEHVAPNSRVQVTADPQLIADADRVVFPGVGAMGDCMAEIRRLGVDQIIANVLSDQKPLLAICVGMQALLEYGEESGGVEGLSCFPGRVVYFGDNLTDPQGQRLKVPHMGWNQVKQVDHPLWQSIDNYSHFYFVHSYYANIVAESCLAASCDYGVRFAAALAKEKVFATQFHPEKSHTVGLQLLSNFMSW